MREIFLSGKAFPTIATVMLACGTVAWAQDPPPGGGQSPAQAGAQQQSGKQQSGNVEKQSKMYEPSAAIRGERPTVMTVVTSPSRLAATPSQFYGASVSLHAPVAAVKGPRAFTLDENAWFAGPDVLVVVPNARSGASALRESQYVTVVGTVRPFVRADLERDFDWFNALPGIDVEFESRPLVVAETVRTADGVEIATPKNDVTHVFLTTAGNIAQVPGRYYGRSVSVRAEVEDVISNRLFTLDEDKLFAGPDLLVLNPYPMQAARDNEIVRVVGTVRPMNVAEFERDYDWFNAADYGTRLTEFERRPVLVAHSILATSDAEIVRVVPTFTLERSERALADRRTGKADRAGTQTGPSRATGTTGQSPQATGTTGGTKTGSAPAANSGPITDVNTLLGVSDANRVVGQAVDLSRVQVQRVEGERTIWVGPSTDRTVLVLIAEGATSTGQPAFAVGDQVSIHGRIIAAKPDQGPMAKAPFSIHATTIKKAGGN